MNLIFKGCVFLLQILAEMFGTTYEIINVIIFCVLGPIIGLILLYIVIKQYSKIKIYKAEIALLKDWKKFLDNSKTNINNVN